MSLTPLNIRRELGIALITICCSVLILPALIFSVGSRIFGAYGSGGIIGFYQATFSDLLSLRFAAWILFLGPLLCVVLLRLTFRLTAPEATPDPPAPRPRREPTLNV